MFNEKLSFSFNMLSKLANTQIIYLTRAIKLILKQGESGVTKLKNTNKSNIFCVCVDSLIVFKTGLKGIKKKIEFENIISCELDVLNDKLIKIYLNKPLKESKDDLTVLLLVDNRSKVVEKLKCYFTIHFSQKTGKYIKLPVVLEKNVLGLEKISDSFSDNIKEEFIKRTKKDCVAKMYNDYMFYLKKNYEMRDLNIFEYKNEGYSNVSPTRLIIDISQELPIEHLNSKLEVKDFAFFAYDKFFKYMFNNFKMSKFWVIGNSNYIKKCNLGKDQAKWECWRIQCRTKPKDLSGFNIIFIFLRRKYIPPLFETYQDFCIILFEEYKLTEGSDIDISAHSVEIVEGVANSLTAEEIHAPSKDFHKIIRTKINSYLNDPDCLDFLINQNQNYNCVESLILGLTYTLKIVLEISEFVHDVKEIQMKLVIRLQEAFTSLGEKEFNTEGFIKALKYTDFSKIMSESDNYYLNFFQPDSQKSLSVWDDKRNDFLVFCLNGGLTYNLLNLRTIFAYLKRVPELSIINPQLNQLLNIRIELNSDKAIEPSINNIVYNMYNIKEFSFNEEVMCLAIEVDYLRDLQEIDSEYVYTEFLKYLLENHFSIKILTSVYFYLKQFVKSGNKDSKMIELTSSMKTCLGNLLLIFLKLYNNALLCPLILTLACKCLIILSNFDKFNKITLLSQNCIGIITGYISHPDEKLAYYSLELLSGLISEARDSIQTVFRKNVWLLPRTLKLLKGSSIPGCFYSTKTIVLVIKILVNLLNIPNSGVKELLSLEKNRKFIKYLFNYLQNHQSTLPEDVEQTILIQEKIYEILEILVNKNTELRRYMEENFRILRMIDLKSELFIQTIESSLGIAQFRNINIMERQEAFMKMITALAKFLKKFISNDLQIIKNIKINCLSLIKLITLVYEHKTSENLNGLAEDCVKIFEILFNK